MTALMVRLLIHGSGSLIRVRRTDSWGVRIPRLVLRGNLRSSHLDCWSNRCWRHCWCLWCWFGIRWRISRHWCRGSVSKATVGTAVFSKDAWLGTITASETLGDTSTVLVTVRSSATSEVRWSGETSMVLFLTPYGWTVTRSLSAFAEWSCWDGADWDPIEDRERSGSWDTCSASEVISASVSSPVPSEPDSDTENCWASSRSWNSDWETLGVRDLDNSYPRQLVPRTTRTEDNSYPSQLVPRTTRTKDNS